MCKFWSKTNIYGLAGILAYAVTVLVLFIPFKGESSMSLVDWQSPLGIIVMVLFALSCGLYVWGICKHEHQMTPREAVNLLKGREEYLPKLKNNIQNQTKQLEVNRDLAGKITFTQYLQKYYSHLRGTKKRSSSPLAK